MEPNINEMFEKDDTANNLLVPIFRELTLLEKHIKDSKAKYTAMKKALIEGMEMTNNGTCDDLNSTLKAHLELNIAISKKKGVTSEQVIEWLRQNGLEDIVKTEPHYSGNTAKSCLKAFYDSGGELPEELFNVFEFHKLVYNKGKTEFLSRAMENK